jgi:hypothetical protein
VNISDPRRAWVPSDRTDVRRTLRAHGFKAPEQRAQEVELESRNEGALRCMRRIQEQEAKQ